MALLTSVTSVTYVTAVTCATHVAAPYCNCVIVTSYPSCSAACEPIAPADKLTVTMSAAISMQTARCVPRLNSIKANMTASPVHSRSA